MCSRPYVDRLVSGVYLPGWKAVTNGNGNPNSMTYVN